MKKLLIGFLAVGLIMGFAMTASAQPNVKASGQLYVYGAYVDNLYLTNGSATGTNSSNAKANAHSNIANRLRMQFEIQIQEGLKLTTRFDALERDWGQAYVVSDASGSTERNISFERAYVTFNALYGVFDVGYQQSRAWGTCAFCDDYDSDPGILYTYMTGPWTVAANWQKRSAYAETKQTAGSLNGATVNIGEGSLQSSGNARRLANFEGGTDNDHDIYQIYGIYRWATGQAGLRFEMDRDASTGKAQGTAGTIQATAPYGNAAEATKYSAAGVSSATAAWVSTFYEIAPYAQWKFGPFDFEGELRYIWGKTEYDSNAKATTAGLTDVDRAGWSLYLMGKYTMGAFYGGLEFAYITGDDPTTTDKNEAGVPGGAAWDPLLMYGNYWFSKHHGAMGNPNIVGPGIANAGAATTFNWYLATEVETNEWMIKPFVGWKVNPNLEIVAQYAYLKALQKPRVNGLANGAQFVGDTYGSEFDLYANYKVYNNLTYTVGFGYFWTGDYFKGTDANISTSDNYLFMNALNLTF